MAPGKVAVRPRFLLGYQEGTLAVGMQENTRVCFVRAHLVEEIAHPVLRVIKNNVPGARRDIAVINAGLHYGVRSQPVTFPVSLATLPHTSHPGKASAAYHTPHL